MNDAFSPFTSEPDVPDSADWTPGRTPLSAVLDSGVVCLMVPLRETWALQTQQRIETAQPTPFLPSRASLVGTLADRPGSEAAESWRWPEPVLLAVSERVLDSGLLHFGANSMSLDDDFREVPLLAARSTCISLWTCPGLGLVLVGELLAPHGALSGRSIRDAAEDPTFLLPDLTQTLGAAFPDARLPRSLATRSVSSLLVDATTATRGDRGPEFLLLVGSAKAPESRITIEFPQKDGSESAFVVLTAEDARQWDGMETDSPTIGDAFRAWSFHSSMPSKYARRDADVRALVTLARRKRTGLDHPEDPFVVGLNHPAREFAHELARPAPRQWLPGLDWLSLVEELPAHVEAALQDLSRRHTAHTDAFEDTDHHQHSGRRFPYRLMPHVNGEPSNAWAWPIIRADGRVLLVDFDAMSVYHDYRHPTMGGGWFVSCLPLVAYLGQQARDFWDVEAIVDAQLHSTQSDREVGRQSEQLTMLLLRQMRRRQLRATLIDETDFTAWGQPEQLRQALAQHLIVGSEVPIATRPEANRDTYEEPLQIVERSLAARAQITQQEIAAKQQELAVAQQMISAEQQRLVIEEQGREQERQRRLQKITAVASVVLGGATIIGLSAALAAIPAESQDTLLQPVMRALFLTLCATFVLGAIAYFMVEAMRMGPPNHSKTVRVLGMIALTASFLLATVGLQAGVPSWGLLVGAVGMGLIGIALILWQWNFRNPDSSSASTGHSSDQKGTEQ